MARGVIASLEDIFHFCLAVCVNVAPLVFLSFLIQLFSFFSVKGKKQNTIFLGDNFSKRTIFSYDKFMLIYQIVFDLNKHFISCYKI